MRKFHSSITLVLSTCLLLFSTSCQKDHGNPTSNLLNTVRLATLKYHATDEARKSGYVPDPNCISAPGMGGMGYHWVNPSLVDPVFEPLKPEAVLYADGPDGKLRLVAVEYLVLNVGQPRPMFGNKPFDVGGAPLPVPHWTLHVWLHEENPSGIFAPFNPRITCPPVLK
jgi:hypothetical protein